MDSILNIVLIPPKEITKAAIAFSNQLQKNNGLFALGEHANIPHISLYTTSFPHDSIATVQANLQKITANNHPISLMGSHYETNRGVWVSIAYAITPELLALQKTIIETLDPLRTITPNETTPFGYYNVGYAVDAPHITLTKLPTQEPDAPQALPVVPLDCTATEIGLCESGEYGTCQRLIARFSLQ